MAPKLVRVHIAKNNCYPQYGIICEYDNGQELWDCDCASQSEENTLKAAKAAYPGYEIIMWDNPMHYSNR